MTFKYDPKENSSWILLEKAAITSLIFFPTIVAFFAVVIFVSQHFGLWSLPIYIVVGIAWAYLRGYVKTS